MASIARRIAGDASSNLSAVFVVQELDRTISLSVLLLVPNKSFGEIYKDAAEIGNPRRRHCVRPSLVFLYRWKVTPSAFPSSDWLILNFRRCMRMVVPIL